MDAQGLNLRELTDLKDLFIKEVEKVSSIMEEDPVRDIPEMVVLDFSKSTGYRAGCSFEGRKLVISKDLAPSQVQTVLRREAFITLLPRELDDVPQVYDLAWAYATEDRSWWERCTSRVSDPSLPVYDAPSLFEGVKGERRVKVLRTMLKALRWASSMGKVEFRDYFALLLSLLRPCVQEFSRSEISVLRALARNPYLSRKELSTETKLSQATISRTLRSLMERKVVVGPEQVDLSILRMKSLILEVDHPTKEEIEALSRFPFTYRTYIPLMSE